MSFWSSIKSAVKSVTVDIVDAAKGIMDYVCPKINHAITAVKAASAQTSFVEKVETVQEVFGKVLVLVTVALPIFIIGGIFALIIHIIELNIA